MSHSEKNSPFDLRIVFGGLCMLVPDLKAAEPKLHVLLPTTDGTVDGHPMEAHEAVLIFDRRFQDPTANVNNPVRQSLDERRFSVPYVLGSGSPQLDPVNIAELAGAVPRRLLEGPCAAPCPELTARVTLSNGKSDDRARGALWTIRNPPPRRLTTWVEWVIPGIDQEGISIQLRELSADGEAERFDLLPRGGRIDLFVFHSPADEIAGWLPTMQFPQPAPPKGPQAHHFAAFYPLVGQPVSDVPTWAESQLIDEDSAKSTRALMGLDYSCLTATAPAEPPP